MNLTYKYYGLFVGLNVTIMITCDTLVYKTIDIFQLKITASGIIFSLAFIFSTLITEVYGYKLAARSIWIMMICQTVYVLLLNIICHIDSDNNSFSKSYYIIYNDLWRVMIGTWISVPVSYFLNGIIISRMKIIFSGRCFFVRYLMASVCTHGSLLLTSYPISLSNKYSLRTLAIIIMTTWGYKIIMSIILLPFAIYLVHQIKKIENTDHFDWGTSYNPFLNIFSDNKQVTK